MNSRCCLSKPQILLLELDFRFSKPSPRDVNVVYLLNDMTNVFFTEKNSQRYLQHKKKSTKKLRLAPKVQFVVLFSIDQCFVYY